MPINQDRLEKPKIREQVIQWIIEGKPPSEVARLVPVKPGNPPVSHQAVSNFRKRHAAEIDARVTRIEKAIEDYALAAKVNRIAGLDEDYRRLGEIIIARAADPRFQDEPGYKTGLMAHTLKNIGGGEFAETVDEYKVDTALVAERRALARAVAEELAQLPRPNISIGVQVAIIREYKGIEDAEPD